MDSQSITLGERFIALVTYLQSDEDLFGGLALTCLAVLIAYILTRAVLGRAIARTLTEIGRADIAEVVLRRRVPGSLGVWAALAMLDFSLGFFNIEHQFTVDGLDEDEITTYQALMNALAATEFLVILWVLDRLLSVAAELHQGTEAGRRHPIKGYVQFARLVLVTLGAIIGTALLVGESPWAAITGIGALSAVLLLIFRETLLSFIAGLQISGNQLVRVGDWIEMPTFGADGDVIDIGLHVVKVQNFDKTIVTIPTHRLAEGGFKNWRGMTEFGGRRFKRSILISLKSVEFCATEHLKRLSHIQLIQEDVERELAAVREFRNTLSEETSGLGADERNLIMEVRALNGPYRTNLDLFVLYLERFVMSDPRIHPNGTRLVRQLPVQNNGALPIEIYIFLNDTKWKSYEDMSSRLFAYFVAAAGVFGLELYEKNRDGDG